MVAQRCSTRLDGDSVIRLDTHCIITQSQPDSNNNSSKHRKREREREREREEWHLLLLLLRFNPNFTLCSLFSDSLPPFISQVLAIEQ
ncbi:hypothetical protein RIF29_21865 [Crotalaria pallida]|uniref:Uncharacterized protein n=1 Tax=Crotalaria pallida TaxID=3830 RepID=A0AAN9F5I8_CROPI